MTTERWTDNALDRLVQTVTGIADLTEQNARENRALQASIARLATIAEQHQQTLEVHQQSIIQSQENFSQVIAEIREMNSEIRGLQTENRRILDQLINRNDEPNS